MFAQMMAHFGGSVTAVQGSWTFGTNLATVNTLTQGGMTLESAVLQTKTAGYARTAGFTNVTVDPKTAGTPGAYTAIYVKFTK